MAECYQKAEASDNLRYLLFSAVLAKYLEKYFSVSGY